MSVHIFRSHRQPATRYKVDGVIGYIRNSPGALLWCSRCRKRRRAKNLWAYAFYDRTDYVVALPPSHGGPMLVTYCRKCGERAQPTILPTDDGPMMAACLCDACMQASLARFDRMKRWGRRLEAWGMNTGTVNRLFSWVIRVVL